MWFLSTKSSQILIKFTTQSIHLIILINDLLFLTELKSWNVENDYKKSGSEFITLKCFACSTQLKLEHVRQITKNARRTSCQVPYFTIYL